MVASGVLPSVLELAGHPILIGSDGELEDIELLPRDEGAQSRATSAPPGRWYFPLQVLRNHPTVNWSGAYLQQSMASMLKRSK